MNLDSLLPNNPEPPKGVLYSYIDGSGNAYYITKDLLQYEPMIAKYSSSGFYDGGVAAKVVLSLEQFEAIEVIIQLVRNNQSDHISNRVKGSGQVRLYHENKTFILAYNTNSQQQIEAICKKMITA